MSSFQRREFTVRPDQPEYRWSASVFPGLTCPRTKSRSTGSQYVPSCEDSPYGLETRKSTCPGNPSAKQGTARSTTGRRITKSRYFCFPGLRNSHTLLGYLTEFR